MRGRNKGEGFQCQNPDCGGAMTSVMDSRPTKGITRRRRVCPKCNSRFTTFEIPRAMLNRIQGQAEQSMRVKSALEEILGANFEPDIFKMAGMEGQDD